MITNRLHLSLCRTRGKSDDNLTLFLFGLCLRSYQKGYTHTSRFLPRIDRNARKTNKLVIAAAGSEKDNISCKRSFKTSEGAVFKRLSSIYSHIYIDEIQDLTGYDLEIVKLLLMSDSNILFVGDPRQVTYLTHIERKYDRYREGRIKEFIKM
ncbi:UvrD-helicase domain-containing protein [Paenibacillus glucanolyticus]